MGSCHFLSVLIATCDAACYSVGTCTIYYSDWIKKLDDNGYPKSIYVSAPIGTGNYEKNLCSGWYEFRNGNQTYYLISGSSRGLSRTNIRFIASPWNIIDKEPRLNYCDGDGFVDTDILSTCNNSILFQCNSELSSNYEPGISINYCVKSTNADPQYQTGDVAYTYYGEYNGTWSFQSTNIYPHRYIYYHNITRKWIIANALGNMDIVYGTCSQENIFNCTSFSINQTEFVMDTTCNNILTQPPTTAPTFSLDTLPSDLEIFDFYHNIGRHYWFNGQYYLNKRVYETLDKQYILYWEFRDDLLEDDDIYHGRWQYTLWHDLSPTAPPTVPTPDAGYICVPRDTPYHCSGRPYFTCWDDILHKCNRETFAAIYCVRYVSLLGFTSFVTV